MFTGIIEEIGKVSQIVNHGGKKDITITSSLVNNDVKIGDSLACNGICLTLISFDDKGITVEVMNETISKTNVINWRSNTQINLERALLLSGRLDGHIVQGHVDRVANIVSVSHQGNTAYLKVAYPPTDAHLLVEQGSIAINGVSLTIAELAKNYFTVALISLTESLTNLSQVKTGDLVNLEYDIIGKYIFRQKTHAKTTKITQAWLNEQGF